MLVTSDAGLQKYLQQVLTQLSEWLYAGSVQKLVSAKMHPSFKNVAHVSFCVYSLNTHMHTNTCTLSHTHTPHTHSTCVNS